MIVRGEGEWGNGSNSQPSKNLKSSQEIRVLTVRVWAGNTRRSMKVLITTIVFLGLSLSAIPAAAENFVYKETVTANFKWKWPLRTVRTTTYTQIKPYYRDRRAFLFPEENVSRYRYHYGYKACKNDWGYYFRPGDGVYCGLYPSGYGYPISYSQVLLIK